MDRPGNPGNLGTLIRSCDALGAHGLIVTGHAVDPYDPATITALQSAGWLSYKSNYLVGLAPALRKARAEAPIYLTRGDGDGSLSAPINSISR